MFLKWQRDDQFLKVGKSPLILMANMFESPAVYALRRLCALQYFGECDEDGFSMQVLLQGLLVCYCKGSSLLSDLLHLVGFRLYLQFTFTFTFMYLFLNHNSIQIRNSKQIHIDVVIINSIISKQ